MTLGKHRNSRNSKSIHTSLHLFGLLSLLSNILLFRSATTLAFVTTSVTRTTARPFFLKNFARSSSSSSMSMSSDAAPPPPVPPVARRDLSLAVYAGIAPAGFPAELPRQSEGSTETLLDPAVAIADPYGWMRDESRVKAPVLEYLKAENAYTEATTRHLGGLRETLYKEMLSTIQETDYTTPRPHGDFWYYTRTFQGKSYTVHCRAPKTSADSTSGSTATSAELNVEWDGSAESPIMSGEQVVLDVNVLAEGQNYCSTGSVTHSPDAQHTLLAYSTDLVGGETCQMYVKDLATGEIVDHDPALDMDGSIRWGADSSTLFYMKMDAAHRPFQLYRRKLGNTNDEPDEMLLEETDDVFWMGISKSLDGKYLFVEASSKETSEVHYLDLHDPAAVLQCVAARRPNVLYDVEHRAGQFWIQSNVGGLPNMALFTCPAESNAADKWQLVQDQTSGEILFDGSYDPSLDSVSCFQNHIIACGRQGGIPRVWIIGLAKDNDSTTTTTAVTKFEMLSFPEEAYDVGMGSHYEYETDKVVVVYDSMVTPTQSLEISVDDTSDRTVLKERKVPGYDKELFGCDRITVMSRDGKTKIPVSCVYRKQVMADQVASGKPVHTHLYGYGSYGACMEADFDVTRLPLLNRGIVYVIVHVRGGGEMGRQWYEEPNGAKYLCKKNTFNDFVDVARWFIEERKMTEPKMLSCEGRSAGGMLIGASINQAPELFKMAIMGVPFVDVACTMVDASIPLTSIEWSEWGNPSEEKYHKYMMEYSPTNNVQKAVYPSCLLTGGLHDPRVQFWEPSKFSAELRYSQAEGSGPVCLKMDLTAGHFSASDRYKYLKELAFDYAFLLDQVGLADKDKQ
jgi:oligopeptidase B